MTLPYERTWAVNNTRDFLMRLCDRTIKRVPKSVRDEACRLLRHYPSQFDMKRVVEANSNAIFGKDPYEKGPE